MKSGWNKIDNNSHVYVPEKYPGPIALDATPSKECSEYHKNSCIQINANDGVILKKIGQNEIRF